MPKTLKRQHGLALIHALLVLAISGAVTYLIAAHSIQRARSERLALSRSAVAKALVNVTALVDATGANPAAPAAVSGGTPPSGGGLLPVAATPQTDGFGSALGYCVGSPSIATDPVYAVVSAGPNKTFETTCAQALAGNRAGDDLVSRVTVSQFFGGFSAVSYHGATVAKEANLGSILTPRPGEVRAVIETGALYVNASGQVGAWTPLSGGAAVVGLVQGVDGVRRWADGTYGLSCKDYRYPSGLKVYRNAVGNGIYRIQLSGVLGPTTDVYCDQSSSGGGWTLVGRSANGATSNSFGFTSATGTVADDTVPYSLGNVVALNPTQVLIGYYGGGLTWGAYSYTMALPSAFFTTYANTTVSPGGDPVPVLGGNANFWMGAWVGNSSYTSGFYFRDIGPTDATYFYGLGPGGWNTAYADNDTSVMPGYGGYLHTHPGWIFVR